MTNRNNTVQFNDALIDKIGDELARDTQINYHIEGLGELHISRQLPALCLYRTPKDKPDLGTDTLISSQASFLKLAPDCKDKDVKKLINTIVKTQSEQFGNFLLLELWAGEEATEETHPPTPKFHLHAPRKKIENRFIDSIEKALHKIKLRRQAANIRVSFDDQTAPPTLTHLVNPESTEAHPCIVLGLEISPVYRQQGEILPYALRTMRRGITHALKRIFYRFSHSYTQYKPRHYHELGAQALTKAVWETDKRLAEISENFDLLLHVTPVNAAQAWREFEQSGYSETPEFHYRPRSADPALLKRELYRAPLERIEDPTLADLFTSKRDELDRQLTLLNDRNKPQFLHGSIQLFGQVDDEILNAADKLIAYSDDQTETAGTLLNAEELAQHSREELNHYRQVDPSLSAKVEVRDDITGILVSHGNFLIGSDARVSTTRLSATINHEIGTHALTYHNGKKQPFQQLYAGMAGYEELQEGLAVFAEYLSGGLNLSRLQLLAGRVIAVHSIMSGASFIETFEKLHEGYGFRPFTAFTITMRVYRGGGYTKDMVYLRGFINLLQHLSKGEELELLYCGKIALEHLPLLEELQWREVLKPIALKPRYLESKEAQQRLEAVRKQPDIEHIIGNIA